MRGGRIEGRGRGRGRGRDRAEERAGEDEVVRLRVCGADLSVGCGGDEGGGGGGVVVVVVVVGCCRGCVESSGGGGGRRHLGAAVVRVGKAMRTVLVGRVFLCPSPAGNAHVSE